MKLIRWKDKFNYIKVLKIAFGSSLSIFIANILGLKFSPAAGIITLLSIGDTKKDTLKVAYKRFFAFLISLGISFLLFRILGYNPIAFGVFLLFFVAICYAFKLEDGISLCGVLVTHFLTEENMGIPLIINEFLLLFIGVGVGIILNLYMPKNTHMIRKDMNEIEEDMRLIFARISSFLSNEGEDSNGDKQRIPMQCLNPKYEAIIFGPMEEHMKAAMRRAYENVNNNLLSDTRYYIQYIEMRNSQFIKLKQIYSNICLLTSLPIQANIIADFMMEIVDSFHEYNNAISLIEELEKIRAIFKEEPMPVSREEFENRAILYNILYGLEEFLILKREFVLGLTNKQIETFWAKEDLSTAL